MVRLFFLLLLIVSSEQLLADHGVVLSKKTNQLLAKFSDKELPDEFEGRFQSHLQYLLNKKETFSERKLLREIFSTTQSKFLEKFEPYTHFSELAKGNYDCVTGSALYAVILITLEIPYEILELENHVYIIVKTAKGQALLESTDPYFGLTFGTNRIKKRQQLYKERASDASTPESNAVVVNQHPSIENSISLHQLAGLHAYNQAAVAFNEGAFSKCYEWLKRAERFYPCERITGLQKIVVENLPFEISMR